MKHVCDKGITLSNSVYLGLYWWASNIIVPFTSVPLPLGPPVLKTHLKVPEVLTSFLLKHCESEWVPYSCGRFSALLISDYELGMNRIRNYSVRIFISVSLYCRVNIKPIKGPVSRSGSLTGSHKRNTTFQPGGSTINGNESIVWIIPI